ncbi:hypothetical protein [Flavobacterium hungaricum]|uniref:SPOR domain-containing protein n=1 Tax=Flavobacterium hungaricum TaxID=2082725 RepID=A0ABR9TML9_9FLAO|nr:hypothetical protein [Flavobacterium hungaricum]MBE8726605.1 hypothetical protein [Flavobacterium hungaricum]
MDNEKTENKASFFSNIVAIGKDLAALLRDFALLIIFLALLLFPETFNDIMIKAGFEEGSIIGMKWKKGIAKSDIALKEAQATIGIMQKQLDSVSKVLNEAKKTTNNPDLKKKIENVQLKNFEIEKQTELIQKSVKKTISSNAVLVENAQKAVNTTNSWGVLLGTDATLKLAQNECRIYSSKYGIQNAVIYYRQGFYLSIVLAGDRDTAGELLSKAKRRRSDSYIVPMTTWCQNSVQRDGYIECLGK